MVQRLLVNIGKANTINRRPKRHYEVKSTVSTQSYCSRDSEVHGESHMERKPVDKRAILMQCTNREAILCSKIGNIEN